MSLRRRDQERTQRDGADIVDIADDPVRQREGFVNAARVLAILAVPVSFLQAALSAPLIHTFF